VIAVAALTAIAIFSSLLCACSAGSAEVSQVEFPRSLESYAALPESASLAEILKARIQTDPFNLVATLIFFAAIAHTFAAPTFLKMSHRFQEQHESRLAKEERRLFPKPEVSFKAEIFHFLGEIEAVFGIWAVPLLVAITFSKGWAQARDYVGNDLDFTEPLFVVVIMTMAASRPILKLSEQVMALIAALGKGSPGAWWLSILTLGPLLGSLITEPAAMTISALLLGEKFYGRKPSANFAYATLGLLFVNVSVGGTLTHFAAPPVLMVASKWGLGMSEMFLQFGWKAAVGIVAANVMYFVVFRRDFRRFSTLPLPGLESASGEGEMTEVGALAEKAGTSAPIPLWVTAVHILFLTWTVMNSHYRPLFVGGFLFYLAFTRATEHHQAELALRPALLVGFFLAGLVVHGGLQGWWIQPVLSRLSELPLFFGAAMLTAFNDNAAITYLASLVPGFSGALKYAVLAGAVAGGGLTVIANAPNPAGQSILSKFFPDGISPLRLFLGALIPTAIVTAAFLSFR
jgi:Putative Na+/H+ antiporter